MSDAAAVTAEVRAAALMDMLARKINGVDCTRDESVVIQTWMREYPCDSLTQRLASEFPSEWDGAWDTRLQMSEVTGKATIRIGLLRPSTWVVVQSPCTAPVEIDTVIDRLNMKLAGRGVLGDRDAVELCLPLSLHEAAADLGGVVIAEDEGQFVIDFTGTGEVLG